jgi:hypothetical protein
MNHKRSEHPSYNFYVLSEMEETEGLYVSNAERQIRARIFHFMNSVDYKKMVEDLNTLIGDFNNFRHAFLHCDLDNTLQVVLQSWGYFPTTQYIDVRSINKDSLKEFRAMLHTMHQLGIYFEYRNKEVEFFCKCDIEFPKFPTSFYVSYQNPEEEFESVETWIDEVCPSHYYDEHKTADQAALKYAFHIYNHWMNPIYVYNAVTKEITTFVIKAEVVETKTWPT